MLPERSRPPNLAVFATASEDSAEFDIADPELVSMLEESQTFRGTIQDRGKPIHHQIVPMARRGPSG